VSIEYSQERRPSSEALVALYRSVGWSSAEKPRELHGAMLGSHAVVTAWNGADLVGLGNAISDGHLVVYFPHLVVHAAYQRRGIGTALMRMLMSRYQGFHQQALLADGRAIAFYKRMGFARAGATEPLWIFGGREHD